jgi:hypothetical protein
MNKSEITPYQNLWDTATARGNFKAINTYIKKEYLSQAW